MGEGHRKSERYRANLCDQHKFCALLSVLLGTGNVSQNAGWVEKEDDRN